MSVEVVIMQSTRTFGKSFPGMKWAIESAAATGHGVAVVDEFPCAAVDEFRKHYRHTSNNGLPFERWCFEQWFLLADWMEKNGKELVFVMDSDVLLFANLSPVLEQVRSKLTLATARPTGARFITREGARVIADYYMEVFKARREVQASQDPRMVSDGNVINPQLERLGQPMLEGWFHEWNICHSLYLMLPGASQFEGHRDIVFADGIPYWFRYEQPVKMATVHCWGKAKQKMETIWKQSRESLGGKMRRLCLEPQP